MKKSISIFLSIVIMFSFAIGIDFSASADTILSGSSGDINYSLDSNGVMTISRGSGNRMRDYVNNGASRPEWYNSRGEIKKIVIEPGIPNIGAYAFDHCYNLTEVDFGEIDTIGNNAFTNCTALRHIVLPSSFNWMYDAAFEGCTSLVSAYLGERWWTEGEVPANFFKNCTSLAVIQMGSNFTGFGSNALSGCSSLTAIITDNTNIQSSDSRAVGKSILSSICSENTYSNTNLTYSFDVSTNTLSFTGSGDMNYNDTQPWQRFGGAVETVTFEGTDAKVSTATNAFRGMSGIKNLNLSNIYSVGWGCFADCSGISRLHFDSTIAAIWGSSFENCTGIDQITFDEGTSDLHIYDYAFKGCTGTTYWLDLPKNTRYIDSHAFYETNFNYIHIFSENVTIGEDAFGDGKGGYTRFFGVDKKNTGVYSWVKSNRDNNKYNWWYFCTNGRHIFDTETVEPTCTAQGYDRYGCLFCDEGEYKSNFTNALGHNYRRTGTNGANFVYECTRCDKSEIEFSSVAAMFAFDKSVTHHNENKFNQDEYTNFVDVNYDGVINGRDLALSKIAYQNADTTNRETFINTSNVYQTIEGFGASGAWWAQEAGLWNNAKDIIKLLYSKDGGINLNIFRYNLGAGSRDTNDRALFNEGTRTNCFLQADGTYDWNNDPGAMNALYIANKYHPNVKVELFSNSAPVYMTKNGKAYGSPFNKEAGEEVTCNLDESNFQAFTDFYITVARHFIDEGYNVTELSPINEPEWEWSGYYNGDGSISAGQEGCHWGFEESRTFYNNYFVPAIRDDAVLGTNGKNVGVSIWESAQPNHPYFFEPFMNYFFSTKDYDSLTLGFIKQGRGWAPDNANIRSYVNTLDTHSYWASTADRQATMNLISGQFFRNSVTSIKCSEYCQMFNDGSSGVYGHILDEGATNGMTIDYGLAMADIIYQDLTILNATEWDWWTACGKGIYTDSLVYINDRDHSDIQTSKRLWCLGNYSKFIQEGAKRIDVSTGSAFGSNLHTNEENIYSWNDYDENGNIIRTNYDKYNYIEESAYLNPDGSVAVVYINNSDTIEYTTFTNSGFRYFKTYVTDETHDLELYQSGKASDAVCIPARSVTTVVLKNVNPVKSKSGAYLFSYFTGNAVDEQRVHFAVSKDGYTFTPLNMNDEVITQTKGTLNCRDPYVFKGQDGYYYIIATDMDCNTGWWGNSNTMVLWRSRDLVNWTDETIINMSQITGAGDIQRCWAPQVIWDDKEQKYMVYFALASWSISQNHTVMYYCYTDDLLDQSHYSYPQLLYKPELGDDKENNAIDGDIIYDSENGIYYLYYKDEDNATICYVTSENLSGPYSDPANPTKVLRSDVALEGCNAYFINGTDTLVMLADAYLNGYFVLNMSNDFRVFETLDNSETTINATSPRHGSVISITNDEYDTLVDEYGLL